MIYLFQPVIYGTHGEVPALGKPLEGYVFTGGYGKGHGLYAVAGGVVND